MVDYSNGKVYRIVCNLTGKVYIGSTTNTLSRRLTSHRSNYKNYLLGNFPFLTSFEILKNHDYSIILIENVKCNNREELLKKERFYIELMPCVNKKIPNRTQKEYYKEYKKEILEYHIQYNELNKEKLEIIKSNIVN